MDLHNAMTDHLLAIAADGRSRATQRLYELYEKRYLEFLKVRHLPNTLDSLDSLHVRQAVLWFQQRRIGKRHGEAATAMFLNVLKTWASYLANEGVWEDSPLRRVQRVKIRKLERQPYTRTEVNAILHACAAAQQPERDRLLVLLLLDTGARISEITGLGLDDIRLDRRTVRVLGKGNRERTIPIGAPDQPDGGPLFRALRAYLKVRELRVNHAPERAGMHLFLTAAGYPLTAAGGSDVIRRLGEAAGVDGAISHRFRHTYCTVYLTRYPGDELGLRRIVGHLSKPVLADYTHIAQSEIAQRAGRVSPTTAWLREGHR